MNSLNVLFHMARADFLERVRRYSFLIMMGLVIWLGYGATTGLLVLSVPPNYVGEINSPWVGALMTVTVGLFLGWFGFYLVKGSIARDYETRVGQILATTPLSRPMYVLGKWLSNFAVLGIMILILMIAGIGMNLLAGKAPLDLWALISPLLFIALPLMAVISAFAVLFETIGWLRGGFGNFIYFFMFTLMLLPAMQSDSYQPVLDITGMGLVADGISRAAQEAYPGIRSDFSFQAMQSISDPQEFHYGGIEWSSAVLLPRLLIVVIGIGLATLASAFFDRFDPSTISHRKQKRGRPASLEIPQAPSMSQVHLTPLPAARRFRFAALYAAELRMLLKGRRWPWYGVSIGLIIAQFAAPGELTPSLLAVTWLWMILLLSGLGNREALHNTGEIVFSAPRPVRNQLPALFLAAVTITALLGSGAALRYLLDGETTRLLAWLGGLLFIPSLALTLGTWTSSRKPFEVIYVTWMYMVLNQAPPLDFVGVTPDSPWQVYTFLAVALFALTVFVRGWQVKSGKS